jgi:hypothetical protein
LAAAMVITVPSVASASHHFGDSPYQDVLDQAQSEAGHCTATSRNKIAARMVSIPWNETTGHDNTKNPAPMTLSRWDFDSDLFFNGNSSQSSSRHRVFWHPGIGMWQLDDSGLGSSLAGGKFSASSSANKVSQYIATRICQGTPIYSIWNGCDNGSCQTDYNQIYTASGPLSDMDTSASISTWGGTKTRNCRFASAPVWATFTCRYVNVNNAEGYTGWDYTRQGDNSAGLAPVAQPFYVYQSQNAAGNDTEIRFWMTQDTGLDTTLTMERVFGTNSRSALSYTAGTAICDQDRGVCSS